MNKLNYGRTFLVGLAFLSISAFWQMYDGIVPLMLKNTFALPESVTGLIMAADNVLAVFLLPVFGAMSDRCHSQLGRRTPFILVGTAIAILLLPTLPILDNRYAATPSPTTLVLFVCALAALLIAMGTYRSPAVALMPDVTPKPLRSKGNAVINLMGAAGGVIYLIITSILYPKKAAEDVHTDYLPLFIIVAVIMAVAIIVLFATIREPRLVAAVNEYERAHPEQDLAVKDDSGKQSLPRPVKKSLIFLLLSISLWFIGYNAVSTFFTTYADEVWNMSIGQASTCLTVATVGAIISYIPVGFIAARIGRKKCILMGVVILASSFFAAYVCSLIFSEFTPILFVLFVMVGFAWASINVNSLPMVVEMCKGSDVGKFTGYYYTFSMTAQIITPIVAGSLLDHVSYHTLFPYAAVFVAGSFVTMLFVKHGDTVTASKKSVIENFDVDD